MIYRKKMRDLTVLLLLVLPLIGLGIQNSMAEPTVWVISAEGYDGNVDLATMTLLHEISGVDCIVKTTTFDRLDTVPFHSDVLVLVGHGQPDGLEVSDTILPWSNLYDEIAERRPGKAVVLACHSPTDLASNIVGFSGLIDAEAGALLAAWHVQQSVDPGSQKTLPLGRVIDAQRSMLHPLNRYVYFVHGYFGSNTDFYDMRTILLQRHYLETYETKHFSYFSAYGATTELEKVAVHGGCTISDFAINLANELLSLPAGSQVNIVSHSLGGVIVREMLRLKRTDLDTHGINFGQIILMGTPNAGTWLADPDNIWADILTLIVPLVVSGDLWPSPVFWSLCPRSSFMNTLNANPLSYSDGIRFTTAAAWDYAYGLALTLFHHGNVISDPIVTESSVHSIYAEYAWNQTTFQSMFHNNLVNDELGGRRTYDHVGEWLNYGDDSDGDGLLDDEESYYHGTNPDLYDTDGDGLSDGAELNTYNTEPLDSDSDNDGLSDGAEVNTYNTYPLDSDSDNDGLLDGAEVNAYGTNPLNWNTDGNSIGDGNEVSWGYNPLDANDPIPASSLIYKAWESAGTTGYVRVNHYSAMDYVKVYVKYKSSSGYWTSYMHVGTDYTPYYSGDYYVSWTLIQGYVQMKVEVKAYDSSSHYLGSDYWYVSLPGGGGGGPVPF